MLILKLNKRQIALADAVFLRQRAGRWNRDQAQDPEAQRVKENPMAVKRDGGDCCAPVIA
jgi:hypothetical protein